jgi:beta-glucosidase-like glycosyl hydrolase
MRKVLPTRLPRGGRRSRRLFLLVLLPLLVSAGAVEQPAFSRTRALPYQDSSLPPATRADDLLGRMTLAEKVGQLAQVSVSQLRTDADLERVFAEEGVGSILSGGGELPGTANNPRAWATGINRIQKAAVDRSRLRIPILYGADAPHGLSPLLGAVIFPQQIGMGATRDPRLVRQVAAVTSRGAKALGIRWIFGPIADVSRDLRWGRYYETYSEDPKLASSLVAATVRGLQGNNSKQLLVAATAKHFIGYSQPQGGRDRFPVRLSSATLNKWFVPPFRAAVDAGAAAVMTQHSAVNGTPVVASHALSTDLLRSKMHFGGVLISDWGDVAGLYCPGGIPPNPKFTCVASSPKDAVGRAVNAGIDVTMIPYDSAQFTSALKDLVQSGAVSQKRLGEAVRRVLTLKFRLGLFEHPYVAAAGASAGAVAASDRKLARKAVGESLTLLKNSRRVLPLKKRGGSILVVGPAAANVSWQMGGWTIGWQAAGGHRSSGYSRRNRGSQRAHRKLAQPSRRAREGREGARNSRRDRREGLRRVVRRQPERGACAQPGAPGQSGRGQRQAGRAGARGWATADDQRPRQEGRRASDGLPSRQRGRARRRRRSFRPVVAAREAAGQLAGVDKRRADGEGNTPRGRQACEAALRLRNWAQLQITSLELGRTAASPGARCVQVATLRRRGF